MRTAVFLLLLCNLLFFSWAQGYFGTSKKPDALRLQQQLLPEQVNIVSPKTSVTPTQTLDNTVDSAPSAAGDANNVACLRWHDIKSADFESVQALLAERFPLLKVQQSRDRGKLSHWVFIPALGSKAAADKKMGELKWLGVSEGFIVNTPGLNHWAISLGVFSTREAAQQQLEQLISQGVKSARVGEYEANPGVVSLQVTGSKAQLDLLQASQVKALASAKAGSCSAAL
ncbi:MAG: SPOR domain-containing protein [Pseudomonadota bacterium]